MSETTRSVGTEYLPRTDYFRKILDPREPTVGRERLPVTDSHYEEPSGVTDDKNTDTLLAIRCQLGEADAWDSLVQRWQPRLWGFVARMISDAAAAEDVLQVIWLRVVRSFSRLRDPERLPSWMFGIARSTIADHLRKQYRQPIVEGPIDESSEAAGTTDFVTSFDAMDEIEPAIERLHPIDREVIVLHYFHHLSTSEIATVTKTPQGTIKSRLHRARSLIRADLNPTQPS